MNLKRHLRSKIGRLRWTREERLERAALQRLNRLLFHRPAQKPEPYRPTPEDFTSLRNLISQPAGSKTTEP